MLTGGAGTRLLVDAVNLSSPGGSQLQVELARALVSRRPTDGGIHFLTAIPEALEGIEGVEAVSVTRPTRWTGMWYWFNRSLPRRARELKPDVIYSPGGIVSKVASREFATMNGVNNMLPFTPEHIRHFPFGSPDRLRLVLLQKLYSRSSRRCDALVVPSRFAIGAMRPYAGDLSNKAFVAMNPLPEYVVFDPGRPPSHPCGGKPYFFYLSVVFWYKNHLELIEAYRRAFGVDASLPELVMAGVPADVDYVKRIHDSIRRDDAGGRIRFLGKIPREEIPGWLHHATVNLFPSTCETSSFVQSEIFGMHGAMACSDMGPMPEVAGGAAELFDPRDPDAIADVMIALWRDESRRMELRKLAAIRAAQLTPEACGVELWSAAEHAISRFAERRA